MTGRRLDALNGLIDRIYASTSDGCPWDVEGLRSFLGTDIADIVFIDDRGVVVDGATTDPDAVAPLEYRDHWAHRDAFAKGLWSKPPGRAYSDRAVFTRAEFEATEIFEGYLEPHRIAFLSGHYSPIGNGRYAGLGAHNSRPSGAIGTATLRRMTLIGVHLRRAVQIGDALAALRLRTVTEECLLHHWALGLIRCDPTGRIYDLYGGAESWLRRPTSPIRVSRGYLALTDFRAQRRLRALLTDPNHACAYAGPTMSLKDRASEHVLELAVVDLSPSLAASEPANRLVVLRDGGAPVTVDIHYLRRRLELTPAQAVVLARLMMGNDLPAIAEARGCTLETVRCYLKALRHKLDCNTQAQLVCAGWRAISFVPSSAAR